MKAIPLLMMLGLPVLAAGIVLSMRHSRISSTPRHFQHAASEQAQHTEPAANALLDHRPHMADRPAAEPLLLQHRRPAAPQQLEQHRMQIRSAPTGIQRQAVPGFEPASPVTKAVRSAGPAVSLDASALPSITRVQTLQPAASSSSHRDQVGMRQM